MNDIKARLDRCFAGIFPGVSQAVISDATPETLPAWDSIAHIRLLSSVGEEFGLELEMDDYVELVSYPLILSYVEARTAGA